MDTSFLKTQHTCTRLISLLRTHVLPSLSLTHTSGGRPGHEEDEWISCVCLTVSNNSVIVAVDVELVG